MSDPYIGQVNTFAMNWAPKGYLVCDGRSLMIQQNAALYSLLGLNFGGDVNRSFNLPDLRGQFIIGYGTCSESKIVYNIGKAVGQNTKSITINNMPQHSHVLGATTKRMAVKAALTASPSVGTSATPVSGGTLASPPKVGPVQFKVYSATQVDPVPMQDLTATFNGTLTASIAATGGGQAMENMDPYIALTQAIAITGYYPPRPE